MKYLSELMEDKQSEAFQKYQGFFAFSKDQLMEGIKKHNLKKSDKLVNMGAGLICPKVNADKLSKELDKIYKESILEDIQLHGINKIILRELSNHECFYTGDVTDCVEKLSDYPNIDKKLIIKVYNENWERYS